MLNPTNRLGRKEPNDDHYRSRFPPEFQQIAFVDTDTGELQEQRLQHREEAEEFYRELASTIPVRVGMEASGHARWFERLLAELQIELWIGDAAEIRTKRVRKQKTDRQDAQLILQLLVEDRFPRIWVPSGENRDLRQLLWHRHRMVQARTRIMNQLQAVALNEGLRSKKRLWRKRRKRLEAFRWRLGQSSEARSAGVARSTEPHDRRVEPGDRAGSEKCPEARRLMTHPGVGPLTALAFVLIIGQSESVPLRQASGQLSGPGPVGRVQRESATAGTHHQAGQFDVAFLAGGSGAGDGAQSFRNGAASISIWRCGEDGRSPRSRWRAGWRFACTG